MSRVETATLVAAVIGAPFAAHQLVGVYKPAFMQEAKVGACAKNLPVEGTRQVGKLAFSCEDFAAAFPHVVVKNGVEKSYIPDINPLSSGNPEVPEVNYDGVSSVSFTLIPASKLRDEAEQATSTYKDSHDFKEDIFGGWAAVAAIYVLGRYVRQQVFPKRDEDGEPVAQAA